MLKSQNPEGLSIGISMHNNAWQWLLVQLKSGGSTEPQRVSGNMMEFVKWVPDSPSHIMKWRNRSAFLLETQKPDGHHKIDEFTCCMWFPKFIVDITVVSLNLRTPYVWVGELRQLGHKKLPPEIWSILTKVHTPWHTMTSFSKPLEWQQLVLLWLSDWVENKKLVGGFNHLEKYESQWEGWHPT